MSMPLRWRRDNAGVVAIEFALIGPALLALLLGLLELSFILYAQTALDHAARQAARNMATGQSHPTDQSGFQSLVFCPYFSPFLSCSGVTVVLQPVTDFQAAMTATPASPFASGSSGSLMLLQATYTPGIPLWPLNRTRLVGTAAYWNEF
jgi:Flp pilus assembly protein TadG